MKKIKTTIAGLYLLAPEIKADKRGSFTRLWDKKIFNGMDLRIDIVNINISINPHKGTLRGMHYQRNPYSEIKIVGCVRGAIFDVAVDLRRNSKTYKKWVGYNLSEDNLNLLYIPEGIAHGFVTLSNNSQISYFTSEYYYPGAEAGIRFNDSNFNIKWPVKIRIISDKDRNWPDYKINGSSF